MSQRTTVPARPVAATRRDDALEVVCAWCPTGRPVAVGADVTHGICEACLTEFMRDLFGRDAQGARLDSD